MKKKMPKGIFLFIDMINYMRGIVMFKSIQYVIKENFSNLYRIFSISKYELLADMRDTKLGLFWNFASPAINLLTYWFVFGFVMERN